jgi:ribose 1,5-bisphosphokinase
VAAGVSSRAGPTQGPDPVGPGCIVLVVGPSGAGKDTILREARRDLASDARFFFPTRVVTREPGAHEEHATLSCQAFEDWLARGAFALHWRAHGLWYGIPAEADRAAQRGHTVVFNASRHVVPTAKKRYAATAVIFVNAALDLRIARLAARNREPPEEIRTRLERSVSSFGASDADVIIDNNRTALEAATRMTEWLRALSNRRADQS